MNDFAITALVLVLLCVPVGFLVLLIVFIVKTNRLSRTVDELRDEVGDLRMRMLKSGEPGPRAPAIPSVVPSAPIKEAPAPPQPVRPILPRPETGSSRVAIPIPPSGSSAPFRPSPPLAPIEPSEPAGAPGPPLAAGAPTAPIPGAPSGSSGIPIQPSLPPAEHAAAGRNRAEWESLIGGRLLNIIGAVALIIGIGFFLRYAFQNNWIKPWYRIGIGLFVGAALLYLGDRSNRAKMQVFAQGLIGAGLSALYLSAYASFNYYSLVAQSTAFLMMAAITTIAFVLALRYNSQVVALIAWAGGFLTPILLSTGHANETALFTYLLLLDVGIIAILASRDRWEALEPMTLGATYLLYLGWYSAHYDPSALAPTVLFLCGFWFLFFGLDIFRSLKPSPRGNALRQIVPCFNAVFFYTALFAVINPLHPEAMAAVTLGLGAVYFAALVLLKAGRADRGFVARYVITAGLLLGIATGLHYSGFSAVTCWAVEAAGFMWCALQWRLTFLRRLTLVFLAVPLFKLFSVTGWFQLEPARDVTVLLNSRALALAALTGSFAACAWLLRRYDLLGTRKYRPVLNICWVLLGFLLCTVETNGYFRRLLATEGTDTVSVDFKRFLVIGLVWVVYAIPLLALGTRVKSKAVLNTAVGILAAAAGFSALAGTKFEPIAQYQPVINLRVAILVLVIAGLLVSQALLRKEAPAEKPGFRIGLLLWAACFVLFILPTVEIHDFFRQRAFDASGGEIHTLWYHDYMSTLIAWSVYAVTISWAGRWKHFRPLIYAGAVALVLGICLALAFGSTYDPISGFTLVANIRMVAVCCLVAASASLGMVLRRIGLSRLDARRLTALMDVTTSLLIVFLLSVETRDYFQQTLSALDQSTLSLASDALEPVRAEINRVGNFEQMALSLVWLAYSIALITLGIWRRKLALRIVAIAMFGFTILKIFIYDLAFLETLYRIFSFIGLGLILLTVSFLYQRYKSVIFDTGTTEPVEGQAVNAG